MRLALSNSLALLTMITVLTMAGCSDERADPAAGKPDINTDHYFDHERLNSQNEVENVIQIFNPETGLSRDVDTFDVGEDKLINLDTDLKKQGFEYMVYAKNKSVFLKSHEKGSAPPKGMISTAHHICSLHPRKSATANNNDVGNQLSVQDLYMVDVVINTNADCDKMTSRYYEVDFSYLRPLAENEPPSTINAPRWRETSSAFVLGIMLRNYRPVVQKDPETGEDIHWGHIGYSLRNQSVQFYNQNFKLLWETKINPDAPYDPDVPPPIPRFFQASDAQLLVQNNQDIYVREIPELFVLGQQINNNDDELPSESLIAQLFDIEDETFADALNPESIQDDGDNFAIKDGSRLYFYDADNDRGLLNDAVYEASEQIEDFEFSLLPNTPAQILIKTTDEDEDEELLLLTLNNLATTTLISAEDVQFQVIDETLYINAFKEEDVSDSWQAHRIIKPVHLESPRVSYDLSMFVFAQDLGNQKAYPLLLQADGHTDDSGALISPRIGPYSFGQPTGLYSGNVFGVINENIRTSNIADSPSLIINDIYGTIFTQTDNNATHLHYFNLSDPEDSLKLMY